MPQTPTTISLEAQHDDAMAITWSVHLLRRDPGRLAVLIGYFVVVTICSAVWFKSTLAACVPVLALLLSLTEYLFPITYTLTERYAKSACGPIVLEMPWTDVRHAYLAPDGLKLSPLRSARSRFEAMRGIFLRFDGNQDEVIAAVKRLWKREEANG